MTIKAYVLVVTGPGTTKGVIDITSCLPFQKECLLPGSSRNIIPIDAGVEPPPLPRCLRG